MSNHVEEARDCKSEKFMTRRSIPYDLNLLQGQLLWIQGGQFLGSVRLPGYEGSHAVETRRELKGSIRKTTELQEVNRA